MPEPFGTVWLVTGTIESRETVPFADLVTAESEYEARQIVEEQRCDENVKIKSVEEAERED